MPISSLFLRFHPMAKLAVISLMASVAAAQYSLSATYTGQTFFDNFDFFTGSDGGFVNYLDYNDALGRLVSVDMSGVAFLRVDTTPSHRLAGVPPNAVRITSKAEFTHGLFITTINHVPGGYCGITSTYAMEGPDAGSGEIYISAGVSEQAVNDISLLTAGTCNISGEHQSGTLQTVDCSAPGGCLVTDDSDGSISYGAPFNNNGGGTYATSWDSTAIKVWFWPASTTLPFDITSSTQDPATFGLPIADFEGCDIDANFANNKIVFDTNFCTDAANAAFLADPTCTAAADTCVNFVGSQQHAYDSSYWAIAEILIFETSAAASTSSSSAAPTAAASTSQSIAASSSTQSSAASSSVIPAATSSSQDTATSTSQSAAASSSTQNSAASASVAPAAASSSRSAAASTSQSAAESSSSQTSTASSTTILTAASSSSVIPSATSSSQSAATASQITTTSSHQGAAQSSSTQSSTTSSTTIPAAASSSSVNPTIASSSHSATKMSESAAATSRSAAMSSSVIPTPISSSQSAAASPLTSSSAVTNSSTATSEALQAAASSSVSGSQAASLSSSTSSIGAISSNSLSTSILSTAGASDAALPTVTGATGTATSGSASSISTHSPSVSRSASISPTSTTSDSTPQATPSPSLTFSTVPTPSAISIITNVLVTSYIDYCPGNGKLTTIVTSRTLIIPAQTGSGQMIEPSIRMITTTKTAVISGETTVMTLTIPYGAPEPTPAAIETPDSPAKTVPTSSPNPTAAPELLSKVVILVQNTPVQVNPTNNSTVNTDTGTASGSVALPKQSAVTGGADEVRGLGLSAVGLVLGVVFVAL